MLCLWGTLACHDLSGLAGTQQLPSGTPDPKSYHTAAGALALYQATVAAFQFSYGVQTPSVGGTSTNMNRGAFVDFVLTSGLLTDELQAGDLGCAGVGCSTTVVDLTDARQLPEGQSHSNTDLLYAELQTIRNGATEGTGALAAYAPAASPALRGHLYALAGYAELLLADLYCSGIPLSTFNFNGDFTYAAGSTTSQVYVDALAKFDTAISLSSDSARLLNFARVGKGRALLALDSLPQAAQAVAAVPDDFSYQFLVDWMGGDGGSLFTYNAGNGISSTVADREGGNGLPYLSGGDPRTASQVATQNQYGLPQYVPIVYGGMTPGIFPVTVANGIEARLIQAEAALRATPGDVSAFLTPLNIARALAAPSLPALPADSVPSTDSGRVSLLFRERAYDLFLTGHRQGDLRRLIRQYGRSPERVYPTGLYPALQLGQYGGSVNAPIPDADESPNPLFHGCLSRSA